MVYAATWKHMSCMICHESSFQLPDQRMVAIFEGEYFTNATADLKLTTGRSSEIQGQKRLRQANRRCEKPLVGLSGPGHHQQRSMTKAFGVRQFNSIELPLTGKGRMGNSDIKARDSGHTIEQIATGGANQQSQFVRTAQSHFYKRFPSVHRINKKDILT